MTEPTVTIQPYVPLYALEIWRDSGAIAARFLTTAGFALPPMNRSGGNDALHLMRFEPTVWLADGDVSALPAILGDDGAITAIGGGIVNVRLSGSGWRTLLMEGGVFDAENDAFGPGCTASTIIDHVNVRLHVRDSNTCDAYVPASFCAHLVKFWEHAAAFGSIGAYPR